MTTDTEAVKFVDALPPKDHRGGTKADHLAVLRANPGQWAEIARYPKARKGAAASRGQQTRQRHSDIEYTVRTVDGEAVLFMRAVSA